MKKVLVLTVVLLLVISGTALATISGSKHDMRLFGGTRSACQYCHAPHHASTMTEAPLWNRNTPSTTYTVYGGTGASGATLSGTAVGQPGGHSLTCLSCHDGTIGVGDLLNQTSIETGAWTGNLNAASGKLTTASKGYFGTSLQREHPVGIVYSSAASAAGLTNAGIAQVGTSTTYTVAGAWRLYGGGDNTGKVECASCHEPHGNDNAHSGGQTNYPFLRGDRSKICTDCHANK